MSSNDNLLDNETEDYNGDDLERNRIKNLIKDFELEDMGKGIEGNPNSQLDKPLRFVLDVNNNFPIKENYSGINEKAVESNYLKKDKPLIAFDLSADRGMIADNRLVPDNRIIADNRMANDEYGQVAENPYMKNVNQSQDSFRTESSEVPSYKDETYRTEKIDEKALGNLSLVKLENITDKDEKSALVFSYIKIITEMSAELEEKRFLACASNINAIAQAKIIDGVTYINYAATVYIYNMVKEDIRKNRLTAAKSGLKLICHASLDTKYVNKALNMLKDTNLCSESEYIDIINKTIEKEQALINTIKQLRRIISDVS